LVETCHNISVKFLDAEQQVNALDITPDKQLIAAAGKELLSNMYLAFISSSSLD
jgi:hypothetical protein